MERKQMHDRECLKIMNGKIGLWGSILRHIRDIATANKPGIRTNSEGIY